MTKILKKSVVIGFLLSYEVKETFMQPPSPLVHKWSTYKFTNIIIV